MIYIKYLCISIYVKKGTWHCITNTIAKDGFSELFRGTGATMCRDTLLYVSQFWVYEGMSLSLSLSLSPSVFLSIAFLRCFYIIIKVTIIFLKLSLSLIYIKASSEPSSRKVKTI